MVSRRPRSYGFQLSHKQYKPFGRDEYKYSEVVGKKTQKYSIFLRYFSTVLKNVKYLCKYPWGTAGVLAATGGVLGCTE